MTVSRYDAEESGDHVPGPDEWTPAEAPVGTGARAQWAPGRGTGPSWWVLYGDARHGPVTVTLDDGQTPPIVFFEPLWLCEWFSPWQPAQVTVGEHSLLVFTHPVHY